MKPAHNMSLAVATVVALVAPALGAEHVSFGDAQPVVDAQGDRVYCVFDVQQNDVGAVTGLKFTQCPANVATDQGSNDVLAMADDLLSGHLYGSYDECVADQWEAWGPRPQDEFELAVAEGFIEGFCGEVAP